jgi:hypothetical protein
MITVFRSFCCIHELYAATYVYPTGDLSLFMRLIYRESSRSPLLNVGRKSKSGHKVVIETKIQKMDLRKE